MRQRLWRVVVLSTAVAVLVGCMLKTAGERKEGKQTLGEVSGSVEFEEPQQGPVVVLFRPVDAPESGSHFVLESPGDFVEVLPAGTYRVYAFEDANSDLEYQPGERAVEASAGVAIDVLSGESSRVRVTIVEGSSPIDFPVDLSDSTVLEAFEFERVTGAVADLSDDRFSYDVARQGMWQPLKTLREAGAGVYLLEPWDDRRVPVLFVHGMVGSPRDFHYLIENLDRTRFQPMVFHYPTGFPLDLVGNSLNKLIGEMRVRLGFDRLYVVAHSMGGLVSRHFVLKNTVAQGHEYIRVFVTISSPFGGQKDAAKGVKHGGEKYSVPAWEDISPGSEFLQALFADDLPETIEYHLFASFEGGSTYVSGRDDGAVALSSQFYRPAYLRAGKVYPYPEDHDSILESEDVSQDLNAILAGALEDDTRR